MNCLHELVIIDLTLALVLFQSSNCSQNIVFICKTNLKCVYILGEYVKKCDDEHMGGGRKHSFIFFNQDELQFLVSQRLGLCSSFAVAICVRCVLSKISSKLSE